MGFNSAFKGLTNENIFVGVVLCCGTVVGTTINMIYI